MSMKLCDKVEEAIEKVMREYRNSTPQETEEVVDKGILDELLKEEIEHETELRLA